MSQTESVRLSAIGQIAVPVQDVARATAFYRDVLGLRLLFEAPGPLSFFDAGGVRLMLSLASHPEFDHPSSILYFRVADIAEAHRQLSARGVVFRQPPHQAADLGTHLLWLAFFADGECSTHALLSEVAVGRPG
ncbi:MAG: VOC family protein [Gemmatimonadetes bacterium]|nr:VOC family protein [Gemmatimonadota bacterium]